MTRRFDSKLLRRSAKCQPCKLNIVGVCTYDTATTVLCHAPSEFAGMAMKSPDWWGAFGCAACHDYIDRRSKLNGAHISDDEQRYYFHRGVCRTQDYWFENGLVQVADL